MPLSLGRDDVVSSVLCCLRTQAADAGVVGATEELQAVQVDGAQWQAGAGDAGATQSVPGEINIKIKP